MLTNLGLGIIIIAWFYQLFVSISKGAVLSTTFILIYSIGVALLTIDGLFSGLANIAYLNLISLLSSVAVLFAIMAKKK